MRHFTNFKKYCFLRTDINLIDIKAMINKLFDA